MSAAPPATESAPEKTLTRYVVAPLFTVRSRSLTNVAPMVAPGASDHASATRTAFVGSATTSGIPPGANGPIESPRVVEKTCPVLESNVAWSYSRRGTPSNARASDMRPKPWLPLGSVSFAPAPVTCSAVPTSTALVIAGLGGGRPAFRNHWRIRAHPPATAGVEWLVPDDQE